MPAPLESLLITELPWPEVRDTLDRDRRLIVPVGACDQYGPHLPVGSSTYVAEAFAERLSRELRILRAPPLGFGVNVPANTSYPGAGGLREKTLHALLNDLLSSWEDTGFAEFIVLTAHGFDGHVEAIASATGTIARVRVIELLNINLAGILEGPGGPQHGGEALTSLMLFLQPQLVRLDRAVDFHPEDAKVSTLRQVPRIPTASPGSLGAPTLATAEKGEKIFEYICEKVRTRLLTSPA